MAWSEHRMLSLNNEYDLHENTPKPQMYVTPSPSEKEGPIGRVATQQPIVTLPVDNWRRALVNAIVDCERRYGNGSATKLVITDKNNYVIDSDEELLQNQRTNSIHQI